MLCTGFACSAYSDHQTLAISADKFSGKDKIKDFFLPAGSVFVPVVNVLYFLPYNVINDFRIDIVINGITVFYLAIVFCVLEHLLNFSIKYLLKYIEKTGGKIVYSKGLYQYFISDIMDEDVLCRTGQEDKKLLLFDNFNCWDEGVYVGRVSPEVIAQLRKSN